MISLTPRIVPHLWFNWEAREAAEFYCSIFPDSSVTSVVTVHDTPSGSCEVVSFVLFGQSFMAISAGPLFQFNEAISLMVQCDTQQEIDEYWRQLSAVPEAEQCGWLKDRYGLSWQIVPSAMQEMMQSPDDAARQRLVQAHMRMKKLDIATLRKVHRGEP